MNAKEAYTEALYRLSKSCPPETWTFYVKAYENFVAYELERSLKTPTSDALIGLGWSRCLVDMRDKLHSLPEYEKKRNERSIQS